MFRVHRSEGQVLTVSISSAPSPCSADATRWRRPQPPSLRRPPIVPRAEERRHRCTPKSEPPPPGSALCNPMIHLTLDPRFDRFPCLDGHFRWCFRGLRRGGSCLANLSGSDPRNPLTQLPLPSGIAGFLRLEGRFRHCFLQPPGSDPRNILIVSTLPARID